ncbi:hypothetical protein ACR3K2_03730 [Cryptosporidium serpentis]
MANEIINAHMKDIQLIQKEYWEAYESDKVKLTYFLEDRQTRNTRDVNTTLNNLCYNIILNGLKGINTSIEELNSKPKFSEEYNGAYISGVLKVCRFCLEYLIWYVEDNQTQESAISCSEQWSDIYFLLGNLSRVLLLQGDFWECFNILEKLAKYNRNKEAGIDEVSLRIKWLLLYLKQWTRSEYIDNYAQLPDYCINSRVCTISYIEEQFRKRYILGKLNNYLSFQVSNCSKFSFDLQYNVLLNYLYDSAAEILNNNILLKKSEWQEKSEYINSYNKIQTICTIRRLEEREQVRRIFYRYGNSDDTLFLNRCYKISIDVTELHKKLNLSLCEKCSTLRRILKNIFEIFNGLQTVDRSSHECSEDISVGSLLCNGALISNNGIRDNRMLEHTYSDIKEQDRRRTRSRSGVNATYFKQKDEVNESCYSELSSDNLTTLVPIFADKQYRQWLHFIPYYCNYFLFQIAGIPGPNVANSNHQSLETFDKLIMSNYSNFLDMPASGLSKLTTISEKVIDYANKYGIDLSVADYSKNQDKYSDINYSSELDLINMILKSNLDEINLVYLFNNYIQPSIMEKLLYFLNVYSVTKSSITNIKHEIINEVAYLLSEYTTIYNYLFKSIEEELDFLHKLDDHSQKFTGLNDGSAYYYYTNGKLTLNFNHYIKESLKEENKSEPRLIFSLNDLWVKYPEITNLLLSKSAIGFDYISVIYGMCESSLLLMQISKIFDLNVKDDNNFSVNIANMFSQQFWKLEFENIVGHLMFIQLTNTNSLKAKILWLLSLYYLFESEIVNVSFRKTFSISINIPAIQELTQKQESFLCAALYISRIVHNLIIENGLMENKEVIYNRLSCKKYADAFSVDNSNIIIGVIERELSFRRPSSNLFASPTSYLCSILHILNETDLITLYNCSITSKILSSFYRINGLLTKLNSYLQEEEICNILQGEELVILFEVLIKLTNKCIYDHIIDKENFNGVIPVVFIDFLREILLLFETLKDRAFSNGISKYQTIYSGIKSLKDILHYLIVTVVTGLHRLFMNLIQTCKGMVNLLKVMMQIVIHLVDIYQEVTSYSLQPRCIIYIIRYLFYLDFSINFEQLNEQNGSLRLSTPNLESSNSNKTDQAASKDENENPISINNFVDKRSTALSNTDHLILDFIILYGIICRFSSCIPTWISEMRSCKESFYAEINSGNIPSELFKNSLYLNNWSNFYDECSEYIDKYTRFSFTHWPLHDFVIDPEIETEYLEILGLLLQCIYGIPVCPLPCKPFNKIIIKNYSHLFKNHDRGIDNMENNIILNSDELAKRLPCPILLLSCNVFSFLLSCTSLTDKQYSDAKRLFYDSITGAIQSLVFPEEKMERSGKIPIELKSMNDDVPLTLRHLSLPFIYPPYMELLHYYFELYSTRKYETENSYKYSLSISNIKQLLDTYICDPFDTSYISEYLDEENISEVDYKANLKKKNDILELTSISILQWDYLEKKVDLIPIKYFAYNSKVFFAKKLDKIFAYSKDGSQELFRSSLSEVVNFVLSRVEKCVYIPFKSMASSFESAIPLIYSNRDSTLWYPGRFGITSHTVNSGSSLPSNKEVVLEALDNLKLVSFSLSVRPDIKVGNLTSASNSIKIVLCELDDINASHSLHLALGFCYDEQYSYYYPNFFERLFIQATSLLNMELEWWNLQTKFCKLNPTNKSSEFICNFGNKVKSFHFDTDSKVVENYDFCSKKKNKENLEFIIEQNNLDHYLSTTDNIYSISFDLICMNMIKLKALYPTLCLRIHLIRCLIRRRYSNSNTKLAWYSHSPSILPMNTTCFDRLETFIYHVLWKIMEMHKHFILIYLPNVSRVSNWFDYNNGVSPKIQNCFWFIPYTHAKLKWKLLKLSIIRYITNNQNQSDPQHFFKVLIDGFRSLYVYIAEALLIAFFQLSGDPNAEEFPKKLLENCIYYSHFEISKAVNDIYEKYRSKLLERVLSNLNSQNSSSCTPQVHNFLRIFYLLQSVQHFVYLTRKCNIFENECFLIYLAQLSDFYSIWKNEISSLKDAKKDIFSDFSNALCDDISDITPALPLHKRPKPTPSISSLSHIGYSYHSLLHFIISGYSSEDCHSYFQKVFMHGRRILNIWKIDNTKLCLDHYTGLYYRRNRKYLSSKFKYLTIPVILSEISVENLINNIGEYKSIRYNSEYFLLNTNTSQNYSFVVLRKLLNPEVLDISLYEANNKNLDQVTSNNISLLPNEYNKDQHSLQQVVYTHLENINSSLDILCDLIIHEVKLIKQLEASKTYEYSFAKTDYLQNFISSIRKENEHDSSNLTLNKNVYMPQWSDNTEIGQLNLSCRLVCIYFDTIAKMYQALIDLNLDLDGRTILKIYGIMEVFHKNKGDIETNIINTNSSLKDSSHFVASSSMNSLSNSMTRILEKLCGGIVSLIIPSCINFTLQKYQKVLENCFYEMFCRSFVGNRTSTNSNKDVTGHDIISIIYTLREYLGITNAKKNIKRQRQTQAKEYMTNSVRENIIKTQKISENVVYSPISLFNDEEIIYSKKNCVIK